MISEFPTTEPRLLIRGHIVIYDYGTKVSDHHFVDLYQKIFQPQFLEIFFEHCKTCMLELWRKVHTVEWFTGFLNTFTLLTYRFNFLQQIYSSECWLIYVIQVIKSFKCQQFILKLVYYFTSLYFKQLVQQHDTMTIYKVELVEWPSKIMFMNYLVYQQNHIKSWTKSVGSFSTSHLEGIGS